MSKDITREQMGELPVKGFQNEMLWRGREGGRSGGTQGHGQHPGCTR